MPTKKVFMLLLKKSKTTALFLICFLSAFLLSYGVKAQPGNNKPVYIAVNYIKTQPGKFRDYLDLLKNYSKKVWEYNFKQGRSLGTYVNSMILPSGSTADYDITVINVSTDLKFLLDDSLSAQMMLKKLNPEYSDSYVQSIGDQFLHVRSLVKREIFLALAEIDPAAPPTKYYTADYMKATTGKEADYVKLEKEVWMPIHRERIKLGVLTDWALVQKYMPYSSKEPYDYATFNFFNDINFLQDSKYTEAIKKAFPNVDINKSLDSTNATRTMVKEERWTTEFYTTDTNTKK
jgi:hypothetical protein